MLRSCLILLWVNCLGLVWPHAPNTLRLLHVIHRHGERNPSFYSEHEWPEGVGELRREGKMQMYNFGRFLRRRYNGFLSETYVPSEIYVRSTDIDRTLMSASCTLAALYMPIGAQVWHPDIQWQPVPVHTVEISRDTLLNHELPCPRYDELFNKAISQSPAGRALWQKHGAFLEEVRKNASMGNESLWVVGIAVQDTLLVEHYANRSMASWVTPETYRRLNEIGAHMYEVLNAYPEMIKLRAGNILHQISSHWDSKVQYNIPTKMLIYSAHEGLIANILFAVQNWNSELVYYAAAIIFELHQGTNGDYFVRMFYKNDTFFDWRNEPYSLNLPGCSLDCPLQQFQQLVGPMKIVGSKEFARLCTLHSQTVTWTILAGVAFSIVAAISVVIFCMCYKNSRKRQYQNIH